MTHTTDPPPAQGTRSAGDAHAPTLPPPKTAGGPAAAIRLSAAAGGAAAASLGLGALAAVVLVLWIASPYPDNGLGGALHIGAGLWLLAQGAELARTQTLSGDPAPVALAPLLVSVLPAWLLYRGTASAVAAAGDDEEDGDDEALGPDPGAGHRSGTGFGSGRGSGTGPGARPGARSGIRSAAGSRLGSRAGSRPGSRPGSRTGSRTGEGPTVGVREAALVAGWVLAGYLSVAALAAVYAATGFVHVDPLTALYVPLFAAAAAGCGAWAGCGRPALAPLLPIRYAEEAVAGLRAALVALGILVGGGALLGGASLAWHAGASGRTYGQLSGPLAGRIAVLLIAVVLVPNLAVWASCYALGTGFSVGAGSLVGPAGTAGYGMLPQFPLLAALPGPGDTSGLGWATLVLPATAACAVAWYAGNGDWAGWRPTLRVASAAALLHGLAVAVLAAWAGGALGTGRLAEFGPNPWLSGGAAGGWVLLIALPAAPAVRWYVANPLHPWRTLATRSWAALRFRKHKPAAEPNPNPKAGPNPKAKPVRAAAAAERVSALVAPPTPAQGGGKGSRAADGYLRFDPEAPMLPLPPLTDPLPWPTRPVLPPLPPSAPPSAPSPEPPSEPPPREDDTAPPPADS